jgi:hypothetical protein
MRFEQWARNPSCGANTVSAVRNVRMARVAKAEGLEVTFGQSPFAIARGNQFERELFDAGAVTLIAELIDKGVLPPGAAGLADLRLRKNGGTVVVTLDQAIEGTLALLRRLAESATRKQPVSPAVVAGATVLIPKGVLLPEAILIPDALAVRHDGGVIELVVGEIKTYPDRGGHTEPGELALARAQAGIYVHGLELVVAGLGLGDRVRVSRRGFLVLTRPGSNRPSLRAGEDLQYQAERARRGFDRLEEAAATLGPDLWAVDEAEIPAALTKAVLSAGTDYCEACLAFCDLAPRCFEAARRRSDPVVLGEETRRLLGSIDLVRAVQLLGGGEPRGRAEQDFVRQVQETRRMVQP